MTDTKTSTVTMSEPTELIRMEVKGIKCDATGCDFFDPTPTLENYGDWLNRPCPKCGANLLTEADYETTKRLVEGSKAINGPAAALMGAEELRKIINSDHFRAAIRLHMDGSGEVRPELRELTYVKATDEAKTPSPQPDGGQATPAAPAGDPAP